MDTDYIGKHRDDSHRAWEKSLNRDDLVLWGFPLASYRGKHSAKQVTA